MKILIVIDQYDNLSNGTTISAKRFVDGLRKNGNEVQVLSTGRDSEDKFGLKTYKFPKVIDKYFKANELKKHDYTAKLHVISNGVDEDFKFERKEKPEEFKDKIIITMVGRYSPEKRQDVLIDAAKKSKYSDKIQLILCGKGQCYEKYKKQSETLKNLPIMRFFDKKELADVLSYTDLYVHSADAEIEAISCLEAIASGNVPINRK